jgi:hypothetical protein
VREPIQVYLDPDDRETLDRLAKDLGVSRAEVLRQGLRSVALEQAKAGSPMLRLLEELQGSDWPAEVAGRHDEFIADAAGGDGMVS